MASIRVSTYLLLLLAVSTAVLLAEVIKTGSLQASSDGVNVTVHWATEDESNISHFEVERSSGIDGNFIMISTMDPKGPSLYEFVDNSAFRRTTTLYQYRIKAVFTDGTNPLYSAPLTVSHTVSGVRRTWGSIKSLFR